MASESWLTDCVINARGKKKLDIIVVVSRLTFLLQSFFLFLFYMELDMCVHIVSSMLGMRGSFYEFFGLSFGGIGGGMSRRISICVDSVRV